MNCSIGCKKHTADLAIIASRFSQESFTSKRWLSSKVEAWNFTKNKLFKTCHLNENLLSICCLKSEDNHSEKCAIKLHILWMILQKQGALNI